MSHQPTKAYKNLEFLNSPAARPIRILCEFEETRQRLLRHGVHNTIVFFGSARTRSSDEARRMVLDAEEAVARGDEDADKLLRRAQIADRMSVYYESARELSARLTEWSTNRTGKHYVISSGAGPGIMEAANRGASEIDGGRSVGLGISLPFEAGNNDYVTRDLSFEFHYFFTRKYWFLYMAKALVIFPGGFGTMDELFETLTLVQTGKIKKKLPIVLFGSDYWGRVINTDAMAEFGTISPDDVNLMHTSDSVDDAFEYLTAELD
ncbi:MAG: LOG family protein [Alphaproteobacteria bacterium]|nr:LOG family protein [Alphaproteobacteria bacterium]